MNCYNGEKYLREAVDGVLAQTYPNWEIIFWDNRSTDQSAEIFDSYGDPRLKYILAPEHKPIGTARALAWPHLTGDLIAVLDADDVWLPTKLEKQIPLFDDPEVGIVISDTLFFNEQTEKALYGGKYPTTGHVFDRLLAQYDVSLETVVFRRATALKLRRGFDADFNAIGDFDMVMRLAYISKLALYPEVLAKWRVHGESFTWKYPQSFLDEKDKWLKKQLAEGFFSEAEHADAVRRFRSKNLRTRAVLDLVGNHRRAALRDVWRAGLDHPVAVGIFAVCFLPFAGKAMKYLYERRARLGA